MRLLKEIERHLARSGTPPSRFGRDAVGDCALVHDLRNGREPRPRMIARVRAHIAAQEGNQP